DKHILGNLPVSLLGGKPFMFPKHVLGTLAGARYIPFGDYVRLMGQFYTDPIGNYKQIAETPTFQARHAGREIETVSSLQAPEKMEPQWLVAAQHWWMAPTIYGIKSESALIYAVSRYHMERGVSPEAAMAEADRAVNESQVSGRSDMRAAFARGSTLGHLAFAFQSQVNSQAMDVAVSWDRYRAMPTEENFMNGVKASTAAAFSVAVFESANAAWNYAMAPDTPEGDKQRNDAALDFVLRPALAAFPILGLPMIRDVARNSVAGAADIYAKSQGDEAPFKIYEGSNLLTSFGKTGIELYQDASKMAGDPNWIQDNFFKVLYHIGELSAPFIKNPLISPSHTADKIQHKFFE
ncbi:MAG: hypothetical protein KGL39_50315, partial [Patescibacteria group bacterium]|nr:hypothetical protein [Patescibacteria group bacterium]